MAIENLYTPDCIRTFTGKYVNVFEPTQEMICIEDIAHALSHQCRFAGHLPKFYSVAQHSIGCFDIALPDDKLQALMHDASEAYLLDIPSPIKKRMHYYKELEENLMQIIAKKFKFEWPMNERVTRIDKEMLEYEWHRYMLGGGPDLDTTPTQAKEHFLEIFNRWSTKDC